MRYAAQQRTAWHAQGEGGGGGVGRVPAASIRMLANQVCARAPVCGSGRVPVWSETAVACARARAAPSTEGFHGRVRRLGCAVKDLQVGDVVVYQSPIDHQKTVIKRIAALVGTRTALTAVEPLQSAPRGERLACRFSPPDRHAHRRAR